MTEPDAAGSASDADREEEDGEDPDRTADLVDEMNARHGCLWDEGEGEPSRLSDDFGSDFLPEL